MNFHPLSSQRVQQNSFFNKRDNSPLSKWWWTVDRWTLASCIILLALGMLLSFAASPAVADRLNLGAYYFVKRHFLMVIPSVILILSISFFNLRQIRRLSCLLFCLGIVLMIFTALYGTEVKGAKRWLSLAGFSLQASELIKPALAILTAWMFSEKLRNKNFPGISVALSLLGLFVCFLLMQPDLGMTVVTVISFLIQLFIAGIPIIFLVILAALGITGLSGAYFFFPHVARRIDQFLDPAAGDPKHDLYQVHQSLGAFMKGGLFGKGPGEGIVKKNVPDAHADFIFAVAGEEFGLFLCLGLVFLFILIISLSFIRIYKQKSFFVILSTIGLISQFSLQALVNMSSSLHLIPTKGMTMPFISYGGSSMIALSIAMGMVLALTRERLTVSDVL